MRVRILWRAPKQSGPNPVLALAALLGPCALIAFMLTGWCVAAELHWSGSFFIDTGFFSHWQSWLIVSLVLAGLSRLLA